MDSNGPSRLRTQASESNRFLLFACAVLLVPPGVAAVVAHRKAPPPQQTLPMAAPAGDRLVRHDAPPRPALPPHSASAAAEG
jgi:hypothetical protein